MLLTGEAFFAISAVAFAGCFGQLGSLAVSKIGRDQLEDWAKRTGMTVAEAEKWLAPLL